MPQIRLDYISGTVMILHGEAGSSEHRETGREKTKSQACCLNAEGILLACLLSPTALSEQFATEDECGGSEKHLCLEFLLPVWQ